MPERVIGRNEPCPCGSGRRYKHCCGSAAAAGPQDAESLMTAALAEQQARRLDAAERLYRQALGIAPDAADALHMLGVVRYERGDYAEAKALILRALDVTGWRFASYRHNLALVVARANAPRSLAKQQQRQREWYATHRTKRAPATEGAPRVAVVIPVYNHERYVAEAIESVYAQTYRHIDLVVIDDGSSDGTAEVAKRTLARSPFPHVFRSRGNRGAAATLNEGIGLASAPFFNALNSDDAFAPTRIERIVDEVAATGATWGFSSAAFIDDAGAPIDVLRDARAYALTCAIEATPFARSTGFALLSFNVAVSTGNLFCARSLWQSLGGFRELRYNHDWEFALRALWQDEPVFVDAPLYRYRLHASNTIAESVGGARDEARRMVADYLARAVGHEPPPNRFAPSVHGWGADFAAAVLQGGLGDAADRPLFERLIDAAEAMEAANA